MAGNKSIVVSLKLDDEEFQSAITADNALVESLEKKISEIEKTFAKTYKILTEGAYKYSSATEESQAQFSEWVYNQGIGTLEVGITREQLKKQNSMLDSNSAAWKRNKVAIENLTAAYHDPIVFSNDMGDSIKVMGDQIEGADEKVDDWSGSFEELGPTMEDVGQKAITIGELIKIFAATRTAVTGTTAAVQLLSKALIGSGTVLAALGILITVMPLIIDLFSDENEKMEKGAELASKLAGEYKKLSTAQLEQERIRLETAKAALEKEREKYEVERKFIPLDNGIASGRIHVETISGDVEEYDRLTKIINAIILRLQALSGVAEVTKEQVDAIMEGKNFKIGNVEFNTDSITGIKEALKIIQNQFDGAITDEDREMYRNKMNELIKQKQRFTGEYLQIAFEAQEKELSEKQMHESKMLSLETDSKSVLLLKDIEHLNEKLELYKKFGKDITNIEYSIAEKQKELEIVVKPPEIEIPDIEYEDKLLPDMVEEMELIKLRAIVDPDDLNKQLAMVEAQKQQELELIREKYAVEGELDAQAKELMLLTEEQYNQKAEQLTEASIQKKMAKYDALAGYVTDLLFDQLEEQEKYSQAEIELKELEHEQELEDLKEQYDNGEISQKEYLLRKQVAEEEYSDYLKTVEEQNQGFIQKAAEQTKDFLMDISKDLLKDFIKRKLAELTTHTVTEAAKTAETETASAARQATLLEEVWASLKSAAASIADAIAAAIKWQVSTFGFGAIATIPASVAAIYAIFNGVKKTLGFEQGGRLVKGEAGYFEGYENEIVAPEKTFLQVFESELRPQLYSNMANMTGGYYDTGLLEEITALKTETQAMRTDLQNGGIKALAYYDDRETKRIYNRGNALNRKRKI